MQLQTTVPWRALVRLHQGNRGREREIKTKQRGKFRKGAKPVTQQQK